MISHWYITVRAVHEWQNICGLPLADDGPLFDRAAKELDRLAQEARLVKAVGDAGGSRDAAIYRANTRLRGRSAQIDIYVAEQPRPEGDQGQVVRVRLKRMR